MNYRVFIGHTSADKDIVFKIKNEIEKYFSLYDHGDTPLAVNCYDHGDAALDASCWVMEERKGESDWTECFEAEKNSNLIIMVLSDKIGKNSYTFEELRIARDMHRSGIPAAALTIGDDVRFEGTGSEEFYNTLERFPVKDDEADIGDLIDFCKRNIHAYFQTGELIPESDILPSAEKKFSGRKNMLEKIEKMLDSSNIAILSGISGSGKASLARRYVLERAKHAKRIGYKEIKYSDICDNDGNADPDAFFSRFTLSADERQRMCNAKSQLKSKAAVALKNLSVNNYIILSDWEGPLDDLVKLQSQDIKCKFIVTSLTDELRNPALELPVLKIDFNGDEAGEDGLAIMREYINEEQASDEEIIHFGELVGFHTYTMALVGELFASGKLQMPNGSRVERLSALEEHFQEIKYSEIKRTGITKISLVKERLKMILGFGFDSIVDEGFRQDCKSTMLLLSFFDPRGVNKEFLEDTLREKDDQIFGFNDAVEWLSGMAYINTKHGVIGMHPLMSEVAYAFADEIAEEDLIKIQRSVFNYIAQSKNAADKNCQDPRFILISGYDATKVDAVAGEEVVRHAKFILQRRKRRLDDEVKINLFGYLSSIVEDELYYEECIKCANDILDAEPTDRDLIDAATARLLLATWNLGNCVSGSYDREGETRKVIKKLEKFNEHRNLLRCAEMSILLGDKDGARDFYAKALAAYAEQNGAADLADLKYFGIFNEMMKYCKDLAPFTYYENCGAAVKILQATDEKARERLRTAIEKLENIRKDIVKNAKRYAQSYINRANSLSYMGVEYRRKEYICLLQAKELAKLAADRNLKTEACDRIDDIKGLLAADEMTSLNNITKKEIEETSKNLF